MPGARVALVAPAGPLGSATELERAVEHARSFGWDPVVGEHALARHGYLVGTDEERARDLRPALAAWRYSASARICRRYSSGSNDIRRFRENLTLQKRRE